MAFVIGVAAAPSAAAIGGYMYAAFESTEGSLSSSGSCSVNDDAFDCENTLFQPHVSGTCEGSVAVRGWALHDPARTLDGGEPARADA
ncbi:MAG: hypothetical protein ACT4PT_04200, partial [Methanobacteriota archaeon]